MDNSIKKIVKLIGDMEEYLRPWEYSSRQDSNGWSCYMNSRVSIVLVDQGNDIRGEIANTIYSMKQA